MLKITAKAVLELAFIDVGQGDACLITTPDRKRVLVDGGEVKLAARYLAARYWEETSAGKEVNFDAIVVTHGDADHFDGLSISPRRGEQARRDAAQRRGPDEERGRRGWVDMSTPSVDIVHHESSAMRALIS